MNSTFFYINGISVSHFNVAIPNGYNVEQTRSFMSNNVIPQYKTTLHPPRKNPQATCIIIDRTPVIVSATIM